MFVTNSILFNEEPEMMKKISQYYNEPHRFYHNWQHIINGFLLFEKIPNFNLDITSELAWIFHDVVYLPFNYGKKEATNEKLSAEFIVFFLKSNYPQFYGHYIKEIEEAQKIIIGTEKHIPFDERTSFIYDVDLSYLGFDYKYFLEARKLIREEYSWLTEEEFIKGTINFYDSLLAKNKIFHSDFGIDTWNSKSIKNIKLDRDSLIRLI